MLDFITKLKRFDTFRRPLADDRERELGQIQFVFTETTVDVERLFLRAISLQKVKRINNSC